MSYATGPYLDAARGAGTASHSVMNDVGGPADASPGLSDVAMVESTSGECGFGYADFYV